MQMLWQEAESAASVVRLTNAAEVRELVAVFAAIAAEQGWEPGGALEQYTQRSVYFALRGGAWGTHLLGGLQLLLPEESGTLPCHILWPTAPLYPSRNGKPRCAHLAMLGLLGEARGHRLHFWHLGIEMWRFCIAVGITTLFIEVTPRVLPLYQYLGWPLTICGDTLLHWGEECYLCTMELPDVAQTLLRRAQNSRHYHRIIAQAFRLESEFKLAA
ncbi:hypothetical protein IAD21_06396 (plasmid) [Abditibacteriota bacterium]|nr:hypothetical protein IAD21_06396 [Abditibacteriota bacterium]